MKGLSRLLLNSEAFSGLDNDTSQRIAESITTRELNAGEILTRQGDSSEALFLVVNGSIAASKLTVSGDTIPLNTFGPVSVG